MGIIVCLIDLPANSAVSGIAGILRQIFLKIFQQCTNIGKKIFK